MLFTLENRMTPKSCPAKLIGVKVADYPLELIILIL